MARGRPLLSAGLDLRRIRDDPSRIDENADFPCRSLKSRFEPDSFSRIQAASELASPGVQDRERGRDRCGAWRPLFRTNRRRTRSRSITNALGKLAHLTEAIYV